MGLQIELLEQSFAAVAPHADKLADAFYRNLFADYPAVKPLFSKVDLASQKKKLIASLKLVVENLRRTETLVSALQSLGLRHLDYGAEAAHYPAVGATLLKSLAEVAGPLWNDELNQAWADAYEVISAQMLEGAAAAVTPQ